MRLVALGSTSTSCLPRMGARRRFRRTFPAATETATEIATETTLQRSPSKALAARFWIVSLTVTRIPFHWLVPLTMSSPTWHTRTVPVREHKTSSSARRLLGRHSERANLWSQHRARGLLTAIPGPLPSTSRSWGWRTRKFQNCVQHLAKNLRLRCWRRNTTFTGLHGRRHRPNIALVTRLHTKAKKGGSSHGGRCLHFVGVELRRHGCEGCARPRPGSRCEPRQTGQAVG